MQPPKVGDFLIIFFLFLKTNSSSSLSYFLHNFNPNQIPESMTSPSASSTLQRVTKQAEAAVADNEALSPKRASMVIAPDEYT